MIALVILAAWDGRRRAIIWIVAGALLPWLPYAAYVLADGTDWRGQTAIYASRFELLNPRWYLDNLVNEYHRYGPGLGPIGSGWLARPGVWLLLLALPLSLLALARRAFRHHDGSARALLVPSLLFPLLFAAFITLKLVNYALIELPLFAIAIGWGLQRTWRLPWFRLVVGVVAAAAIIEGGIALARPRRSTTAHFWCHSTGPTRACRWTKACRAWRPTLCCSMLACATTSQAPKPPPMGPDSEVG